MKSRFLNFFFGQNVENPQFLIFFRTSIGTLLLIHLLSIWADFTLLYGDNSVIPSEIQNIYEDKIYFNYDIILQFFISNFGFENDSFALLFKCVFILFCLLLIIGFYSRIIAFLLLLMQIALVKSGVHYVYGIDYFASMSLIYLTLFPSDDYFSLRNSLFPIKVKSNLTPFRRLFQIHICIAYFFSGFGKVLGYNWWNGEAIWKAIHLPSFTNDFGINIDFLGNYPIIFILAGWGVIIIEICYPLFINLKKTKTLWLYLTISMHIGIIIFLNLYFFSVMMIIWNLTNYYFKDNLLKNYNHEKSVINPIAAWFLPLQRTK